MRNPISNVPSLPTELLYYIIKSLPQRDLTALCRISIFHKVITSYLYRKVVYNGLPQSGRCLQFHSHHSGDDVLFNADNEASTIYKLAAFRQTLIASPQLRSFIDIIYMNADSRGEPEFYEEAEHILRLLGSGPHVVYLSSNKFLTDIPLKIQTLTSLNLTQGIPHNDEISELDYLYSLFSVDSLRRLSIERCNLLRGGQNDDVKMLKFSKLAHLSYTEYGFQSDDLGHLMGWPAKLQSLWYAWSAGARSPETTDRTLATALENQKPFLEELYIYISCFRDRLPEQMMLTCLNGFSSLRRLGLPREILMTIRPRPENRGILDSGDLPCLLEELQIEMEEDFPWLVWNVVEWQGSLASMIASTPTYQARCLLDMLASIVAYTPRKFSRLRRIALWLRCDKPASRLQRCWPPEEINIESVRKQFAERGVELICLQEPWPPLFA